MFEELDALSQTNILRDDAGVARAPPHDRYIYIEADARTPQLAAGEYLSRYGDLLRACL
jgi:zinc metalloprotease ZmpB